MERCRSLFRNIDLSLPDYEDEDPEVAAGAGTEPEPASAWTGAKRPKIQSTPTTPGDLSIGNNTARDDTERSIVHGQEQDDEDEIEAWDDKKLNKEIRGLRKWMHFTTEDEDYASFHDDRLWAHLDEEKQKELNQRLALCRIRAHEEEYRVLDDARLLKLFPPEVLERKLYYKHYEYHLDWFFDPEYCKLANVEDYQRLVLRVTTEFEDLEICPYSRNTLVDDQQFVQFWETLSRKNKLIEKYITARSCERPRIEKVLLYHALKIAEKLSSVYETQIVERYREFLSGVDADYTYAGFLTEMWELLAKKQMNFTDALRCVYNEGKYRSLFHWVNGYSELSLSSVERLFKPHLDRIVKKVTFERTGLVQW